MAWKTVEIGSFLKERSDRFKPQEANTLDLKRIEKIDFQGKIHVIDHKPTKTNMILVKKGDLVISGINVEKGALAVYEEDEDALATIHYSSYEYDKNQVDIEYLKWFLKSSTFQNIVKEQAGGGIKTELKPKKFLPLKIQLPRLNEQIDIARKINNVAAEIDDLAEINNHNQTLLIQLRQAILQEAVQGKLIPQDPNDEPASKLLKRITEGKIKKQKPLPPITEEEIPYELPEGWEWVRLDELGEINPRINVDNDEMDVSFIPMKMISGKYGKRHSFERKKWAGVKKGFTYFMDNDVGLAKITPCFENGKSTVFKGLLNGFGAGTTELHIFRQDPKLILPGYVLIFFKCPKFLSNAKEKMTGTAGQKRVPRDFVRFIPFPLPSISEQKRIVAKVDQLMHLCDELETRLNQSKKDSEMLMQAVLYEAFS